MKNFIVRTTLFISIIIAIFIFILSLANGYTDPFYLRFTTPKQDNLILGTSRSAQGLQPMVFKRFLNRNFYNFSFTNAHSPFGSVYLNSIKHKLNPNIKDGIFIVTVDPWSISNNGVNPNDTTNFTENNLVLANTNFVNMNPNFEYLLKNLSGEYYKILMPKKVAMFLHDDGWLEVNVSMDSAAVSKRIKAKMEDYRKNTLPSSKLSSVRLSYLKQTVEFLKLHGKVYIARLPVSPQMYEIEQELMFDFNDKINQSVQLSDGYLDMTNENNLYQFIDGNHLWKESGKLVSQKIAEWIKSK